MSLKQSQCDELRREALSLGADALGFARCEVVDARDMELYRDWIERGCHGEMGYLERYDDVRSDPSLLLPGARTVIVAAFNYNHEQLQCPGVPVIARYAHGDDYHDVVHRRLEALASMIRERHGGETRVCVDTAPLRERYWAVKAGVGFRGLNGCLIVPGVGSFCFIGVILSTVEFPADKPLDSAFCDRCGACLKACPGKALNGDGTMDARRCLSYLTIEYRGELPAGFTTGGRLYGCDSCQAVCPHNQGVPVTRVGEFCLRESLESLDEEAVASMTPERFSTLFKGSAIKRAKLSGLLRNVKHLR